MNIGFLLKKKAIYAVNAVRGVIISSLFLIFEGQVYDWDRFQKTGPHTRTKITLKLPKNPTHECFFRSVSSLKMISLTK